MKDDISVLNKKRKVDSGTHLDLPAKKKRKKVNLKKVHPPTAEEISCLRETENVFHSNLFRMQITEILTEVKIKDQTRSALTSWIEKIKTFLADIEFNLDVAKGEPVNISNVVMPMRSKTKNVETKFQYFKPKSVDTIGSFNSDCVLKLLGEIDIYVEIPKECFQKEDYLNEKYFKKRNIYLTCLASKLLEAVDELSVSCNVEFLVKNSIDKPLLRLKSTIEKLRKYSLVIHIFPEAGTFKESRFNPSLNNVRHGWYFETTTEAKLNFATPLYNASICQDLVALQNEAIRKQGFDENPNFKDAFMLLKIWLRQRKLCEGPGSFSGFMLSMFLIYLLKKRKLNQFMSSYQIIRFVWISLDQIDWHTEGISLADVVDSKPVELEVFKSRYDVVFIDVTGHTNLAAALNLANYLRVKRESKYAVQYLDDSKTNSFPVLFMTPVLPLHDYDYIFRFSKLSTIRKNFKNFADVAIKLDLRNDYFSSFLKIVISLLKKSLNHRVSTIDYIVEPSMLVWPVNEKMPNYENLMICLKIDPAYAFNVIEKGPVTNSPEAAEFREFWGSKAELRRFRDGVTYETVCWANSGEPFRKKREIICDIIEYILDLKFQIKRDSYLFIGNQFESVVFDNFNKIFNVEGTGEEATLGILSAFNDLSLIFRQLKDIPLEITSIQGVSGVFRYSELFPTLPNVQSAVKKILTHSNAVSVFKTDIEIKHVPLYIPPIEAVIQFSVSSKWPNDLDAIRHLQAAFFIKLASTLSSNFKLACCTFTDYIDILKNGYVFRIRINNNSEISAVKREISSDGTVQYCENDESLRMEKYLVQLPVLTSAIHGLYQQFAAFGPACAMSKRWLRCQLIDEFHFPDVCVDLLMCHLFLNSLPYTPSHQPQTMFIRFLELISTTGWFLEPYIVNFNDELTREDVLEAGSVMSKNRDSLPGLILVTPFDKSGATWTNQQPSLTILDRVTQLAKAALLITKSSIFEIDSCEKIKAIFRPPLKGYDILIWTLPEINSLRWMAVDANPRALHSVKNIPDLEKLPVVGFQPTELYIQELRKHYSEHCLFFYDFYGGNFIGVVLKPGTKTSKEFKISNLKCCVLKKNKLTLNLEAMIDDFRTLGTGIVSHVEFCKENE